MHPMAAFTRRTIPLLLGAATILVTACGQPEAERDLAAIQASDTLVVGTLFNSTSYFLYRGAAMGYEYELLREFAEAHDVAVRMVVAPDYDALAGMLRDGRIDVAAARLLPEGPLGDQAALTEPLFTTERVLVQRAGPPDPQTATQARAITDTTWGWDLPDTVTVSARLIETPEQLAGERVHVSEEVGARHTLIELADSIGGDIDIVEIEADVRTETLIRRVALGQIDLTVAKGNLAELLQERFTNIVVRPTIGPPTGLVWAVRESSPDLLQTLNQWILAEREGETFTDMYNRYYVDRGAYRERVESEYLTSETGRLSDYDELIARHAATIDWDWRLLASQMYQESLFDPDARSWAGAAGLLQLMPATAREVGVENPYDPEENVAGGVRYLQWLEEQWIDEITDPDQRLRFVLASYNTGRGHVQDAQRLAEKNGHDPQNWEQVAHWLLQKSKRSVFTDPVVRYGYARGLEPVTYVQKILDRYRHYQQFVSEQPAALASD